MYDSFHEYNPRSDKDGPFSTIRSVIRSDVKLKVLQVIISSPRILKCKKKLYAIQISSYYMIDATLVESIVTLV
jgi:hypothetical protein